MKTGTLILIIIIGAVLLLGGCGCSGYNSMVKLDENVKAKWANVQSDYQRRSDLIPNLVSTVKVQLILNRKHSQKLSKPVPKRRKLLSTRLI